MKNNTIKLKSLLKEDRRYISNIWKTWDSPVDMEDDLRSFIGNINEQHGPREVAEYTKYLKDVLVFAEKMSKLQRRPI